MATISTKRARQRAKKAAAEGGSHQKALDGIARAEGHAHWGAMIRAEEGHEAKASDAVDFMDRHWVLRQGDDVAEIRAFITDLLDCREGDGASLAFARFVTDAWLEEPDAAVDLEAFVVGLVETARLSSDLRREEASQAQSLYAGSWQVELVRRLADVGEETTWKQASARMLRAADRDAIASIVRRVMDMARVVGENPVSHLGSSCSRHLSDGLLARLYSRTWGRSAPGWNVLAVASRIVMETDHREMGAEIEVARRALGSDFESVVDLVLAPGLDRLRKARIIALLIDATPFAEHPLLWRYRDSIEDMREHAAESVMTAWLEDAILKVSRGRAPFSYNPFLGFSEDDGCRLSTLALIGFHAKDRLRAPSEPEPHVVEGAVHLVEDVVRVILKAPRIDEFEAGVRPSYPSVRRILERCVMQPGQLELFATFNRLDPELIASLRKGLADDAVRTLAIRALDPFENAAIRDAAA